MLETILPWSNFESHFDQQCFFWSIQRFSMWFENIFLQCVENIEIIIYFVDSFFVKFEYSTKIIGHSNIYKINKSRLHLYKYLNN